ncbi:MAG: MMPL family transporter [Nitrospirota bacterium]
MQTYYNIVIKYPKTFIIIISILTILFYFKLRNIRGEYDARVFLPKGHPAIIYDEKVDEVFGVKDSIIIGVVNEKEGIYNPDTLERIKRITEKVASLPGIIANRKIDVASLSTASVFRGKEGSMGVEYLMEEVPYTREGIEKLKENIRNNRDIFVGNIVSEDGTAAMIRAKLKEGQENRFWAYSQIINLLKEEGVSGVWEELPDWGQENWNGSGDNNKWWNPDKSSEDGGNKGGNKWWNPDKETQKKEKGKGSDKWQGEKKGDLPKRGESQSSWHKVGSLAYAEEPNAEGGNWDKKWQDGKKEDWPKKEEAQSEWKKKNAEVTKSKETKSEGDWKKWQDEKKKSDLPKKDVSAVKKVDSADRLYIAGRPVIEVSSGKYADKDMKIMIPLVILVMMIILFILFRSVSGVLLPLFVMVGGIIWTIGTMAILGYPIYTISTMMPVILVAVGIADGIHLLNNYYDNIVRFPEKDRKEITLDVMKELSAPMIVTSVTTSIGFLALLFAEMPPFREFGVFTAIGVIYCWIISVTLLPAFFSILKPKVSRSLIERARNKDKKDLMERGLCNIAKFVNNKKKPIVWAMVIIVLVATSGSFLLYVDSSWMDDFGKDSPVTLANNMLNEKFAGTIFLNVVIEGDAPDAIKSPELLKKMEALQERVEKLPYVGNSLSIVDYIKGMNKTLHGEDERYKVIPASRQEIGEYLFLYAVSGRPEQLDEIVDYNYRQANIKFAIKTDHTKELKAIINEVNSFVKENFQGTNVKVNLAGSGNNSYIWAELLIKSQTTGIIFSKIGVFLITSLLFRSFIAGIFNIIPITITTILIFGLAGLARIPLDVSTALAAGIAIGVGIDYTIHYIFRYKSEINRLNDHNEATISTMLTSGKAIIFNALVVTIGFMVLFFSQFPPNIKLGYFVASYMIVSCLTALICLPILFRFFKPSFLIIKKD